MARFRKAAAPEWPRLDLPKHRLQSLAMSWRTAIEDPAGANSGSNLLEDLLLEGVYTAITRYTRNRIDLRCVQVAIPRDEGGYDVQVTYEVDPDWLPWREPNDKASVETFVEFTHAIDDAPTASCRVEYLFPAPERNEPVVKLPFTLEPQQEGPWPIGAVTGLRGVGVNPANDDQPTCRFTLDLEENKDIWLLLEFAAPTPPAPSAPGLVLSQANMLSEQFVRRAPR
jgi:hypothetical protein